MSFDRHAWGLDARLKEFLWLAPVWSVGLSAALISLGVAVIGVVEGRPLWMIVFLPLILFSTAMAGLMICVINTVFAYIPSVLVWGATFRLTRAALGERGAAQVAAAATAVVASLVLAVWLGFMATVGEAEQVPTPALLLLLFVITIVSVAPSIMAARTIYAPKAQPSPRIAP